MILRHAITTGVHPTEAELRLGMPLLRGFAEPSDRFSVILRHAFADGVHHPKVLLRLGHNAAFRYFGGVPRRIVYDNTKLAVARILGDGTRQRTQVFSELQSHDLFDDRFGRRVGRGDLPGAAPPAPRTPRTGSTRICSRGSRSSGRTRSGAPTSPTSQCAACGCLYLVVIMDWASRHVLAWRLSNTLDAGFCVEALDDALARHGPPEIFNTDQGSQFTSGAFTGHLQAAGIQISMDGRGRCMDNIFIERLWRSLKYEAVYLHELADGLKARRVIGEWIGFYTTERPHSALGGRTPAEAYRGARPADMMDTSLRAVPTSPQAAEHRHGNQGPRNQGPRNQAA